MKLKKSLLTILTATTLTIVGCSNNQNQEEKPQTEETTKNSEQTDTAQAQESSQDTERQTQFIQEAFDTLLNYDNETYEQRNEQVNDYFTVEALEAMIGYEHIDPQVTFNSSTTNEKVYQSLQSDNGFIYITDISFQVEDNPTNPIKNIYEFELIENNNEYRIDNVQVYAQPIQEMQP